jgi:uncharacterized membrane protein
VHTATQDLQSFVNGTFHGAGVVHGVHYGVLIEIMMFVIIVIIIVVVATIRFWERSVSTTTKTKTKHQQHNQAAESKDNGDYNAQQILCISMTFIPTTRGLSCVRN